MNELQRLQAWYLLHCNGDWEHEFGVRIETLDNPGWSVEIDLAKTGLEHKAFGDVKQNPEDEVGWIHCKVEAEQFRGYSSANNLAELLGIFLEWAEN